MPPGHAEERPSRAFRSSRRFRLVAQEIGRTIRARRQELGWTLEAAAGHMRLDFSHLQRIESGQINLTLATLIRVADALGTNPAVLLPRPLPPQTAVPTARAPEREPGRAHAEAPATSMASEYEATNPVGEPENEAALRANVGRRVASLRKARGWSLQGLGQRAGVSAQFVQRVEAGKQNLTFRSLVRLANALEVRTRDLWT